MATAPATLSFGGNPATGEAPTTYTVDQSAANGVGTQVGSSRSLGSSGALNTNPIGVYNPDGLINQNALIQGVKDGTVSGSLDANGNYVPPSTTTAQLQATGTVSGTTPGANTSTGNDSGGTSTGLQMPTGDAAKGVFDPATGQQVNPSQSGYNAVVASKTPPPQDSASGVSAATAATTAATQPPPTPTPPAVTSFLQSDTVAQQAAALMEKFAPAATTTELNNQIAQINTDKTVLAGLNTQLMDIKTVMAGTQDDIRNEINAAGGFSTESQVDALTVARNKTLLTQATQLTDQIATQNQVVANDTSLLTDEKDMAATQFNEQSSVYKMAQDNYNNSLNAAQGSLNSVIKAVGYSGLYASLMQTGGVSAVANAEQVLGLEPGQLSGLGTAETAAIGQSNVADLLKTYPDAGIQPTDSLAVAQAKVLQSPTYKADLAQKNASAASSRASAAKTEADLAFEKANGGLTPAEVQANQKAESDQVEKFQLDAATLIGNMVNKTVDWNTAWNQLHAEFPEASTQTIDNALNATQYRSKYGG